MTQEKFINLAAFSPCSSALGPGKRAVIWVQGCPFFCEGCISAAWRSFEKKEIISVSEMANKLVSLENIGGITISGGEPFAQADALAELIRQVRKRKKINVICFTGYVFQDLISMMDKLGIRGFLEQIDVLIDGPYIQDRSLESGLRGSANQRFLHLTDALLEKNLAEMSRNLEILGQQGSLMMVGIPSPRELRNFDETVNRINQELILTGFVHQEPQV